MFDLPGTPTPKHARPSRSVNCTRRDERWDDIDTLMVGATSPLSLQLDEFERSYEDNSPTKRNPRPGASRCLSTTSISTISEFPGDPPPKITPAERFYARHLALDKVGEILQRNRSQTSVPSATSPGKSGLDTVEEHGRFGGVGREFKVVESSRGCSNLKLWTLISFCLARCTTRFIWFP